MNIRHASPLIHIGQFVRPANWTCRDVDGTKLASTDEFGVDVAIDRSDGLGERVLRFPRVLLSLLFVAGLVACGASMAARPIAPDGGDLRWNATGQQARTAPSASNELRNRAFMVQKADAPSADAAAVLIRIEQLAQEFHADAAGLRGSDAWLQASASGRLQARAPPALATSGRDSTMMRPSAA